MLQDSRDSQPRQSAGRQSAKLGVLEHLIKLVRAFRTGVTVKITTGNPDDPDVAVQSGVGVKKGDSLAPVLLNLLFQACMEAIDATWPAGVSKSTFRWKADGKIIGRVVKIVGDTFMFNRELYADDARFLFASRAELQLGLVEYLTRRRLESAAHALRMDQSRLSRRTRPGRTVSRVTN